MLSNCNILITGANGFIGKNLVSHLNLFPSVQIFSFIRGDTEERLSEMIARCDFVVHLAGENRPKFESDYENVNVGLTSLLCNFIKREYEEKGRHIPLLFASSIQVDKDNPYGQSKLKAEQVLQDLSRHIGNLIIVFRLPGIFGKWCKPNYNSVVATYCHNLQRNIPIDIKDPLVKLRLSYVDDVVSAFINTLSSIKTSQQAGFSYIEIKPEYVITLGDLALKLKEFNDSRATLMSDRVGVGLVRALYATFLSHLPPAKFFYNLYKHKDHRGTFVEMLKTTDCGQLSYFTANPGATRGGHYHNTKAEKFLVVKGEARFRFRHLITNELIELQADGDNPQVIDTIPGWIHDITNTGKDEIIVILWANEKFDPNNPDTINIKI